MPECEFEFSFEEPVDDVLARARQVLVEKGGTFEGNDQGGTYSLTTPLGDFRGTFEAGPRRIAFAVTEKPFLIPCRTIERTLKEKLFGDPDEELL